MKKILLATMVCIFLMAANAYAFVVPFYSTGTVDPNYSNSYNPATLTGTARYYFSFADPNVAVNQLSLRFESDVFDLSQLDASDIQVVNPPGWFDFVVPGFTGEEWSIAWGTPINTTQDPIILQANYVLLGNPESLAWDEGGVWEQTYVLNGTYDAGWGCFNPGASSGGSTSAVPEPASMLLLGLGIFGLFGLKKRV